LFALGTRDRTGISVAHDRNPPYMLMSDGQVRNSYTLKLRNMEDRPRRMEVAIDGLPGAVMWSEDMPRSAAARTIVREVPADETETMRAYVVVPPGTQDQDFTFALRSLDEAREHDTGEAHFDAPGGAQ
jgi:polyferredoxin